MTLTDALSALERPIAIIAPIVALALGWWLGHRSRVGDWQREDRLRAAADKRRVYAAFLGAAERFMAESHQELSWLRNAAPGPMPPSVATAEQGPAEVVFQELSLLAPASVAKAAQSVRDALLRLEIVGVQLRSRRLGVEVADMPEAEIERRRQAARHALTEFVQVARSDLGTDGSAAARG